MRKTLYIISLVCALILGSNGRAYGQQDFILKNVQMDSTILKLSKMTVEDYMHIELPSLETMYDNVSLFSESAKAFEFESKFFAHEIKTERRKPLEWIKLFATYSFGNMDLASIALQEASYQVWTRANTSQRNAYFNVGATISLNLMEVVNYKNRIDQARDKALGEKYRRDAEVSLIKEHIIDLYCTIVSQINQLHNAFESMVLAKSQYYTTEMDFINNSVGLTDLNNAKSTETNAIDQYELVKKQLNIALLQLEVISCTPIISNIQTLEED